MALCRFRDHLQVERCQTNLVKICSKRLMETHEEKMEPSTSKHFHFQALPNRDFRVTILKSTKRTSARYICGTGESSCLGLGNIYCESSSLQGNCLLSRPLKGTTKEESGALPKEMQDSSLTNKKTLKKRGHILIK